MRVALISHGNLDHVLPYLEHMVGGGWDVHWLQIAPGQAPAPDGVTVHLCYKPGRHAQGGRAGKLAGYIGSGKLAGKLLKRIAPDIVSAHYASSGGFAAWLSKFRPYVVTIHGGDLIDRSRSFLGRFMLRRILGAAAAVNPVCEHMSGLLESLGVRPDRITPLPFGIEPDRFACNPGDNPLSAGLKAVCTRSLNKTLYDIPTVIRGIAEARRLGAEATVTLPAGGRLEGDLRQLGFQLDLGDAIEFGGGYKPAELPEILSRHNVYVSASLFDGASLSLMEAMAAGLFPVVSDIPANREWLEDGKTALFFPPGDFKRLGGHLASLPGRGDLIARGVEANRQTAFDRADRRKNMQRFMELLQRWAK